MTEVRWNGHGFALRAVPAGWRGVTVPADKVVFYLRQGTAIPVGKAAQNTAEVDLADVRLLGPGESYVQYLDDGISRDYGPAHRRTVRRG